MHTKSVLQKCFDPTAWLLKPVQPAPHARLEPAVPAFKNELPKIVVAFFAPVPSVYLSPPAGMLAFVGFTDLVGDALHDLVPLLSWPSHIGSIGNDLCSVIKELFLELRALAVFPLFPAENAEFVATSTSNQISLRYPEIERGTLRHVVTSRRDRNKALAS